MRVIKPNGSSALDLKNHPAADIFPLMSDDELDALAADIKANGLLHPIIVQNGVLIDGRNRRMACLAVGIEPEMHELGHGVDPRAYILSANINRRHLSKGQRAMAVAMMYPDAKHGGDRKAGASSKNELDVATGAVSEARTVLRWVPEIAELVMAGTKPLNEAYAEAQRLKEQADAEPKRLERLRVRAPDLADLVEMGQMRLTEAESAHATRLEDMRRQRQANLDILNGLDRMFAIFADDKQRHDFVESLTGEDRVRATMLLRGWQTNLSATVEAFR